VNRVNSRERTDKPLWLLFLAGAAFVLGGCSAGTAVEFGSDGTDKVQWSGWVEPSQASSQVDR